METIIDKRNRQQRREFYKKYYKKRGLGSWQEYNNEIVKQQPIKRKGGVS